MIDAIQSPCILYTSFRHFDEEFRKQNVSNHNLKREHSIGLRLVIEGIETEAELQSITALGPDYIQGYYYSKPCPEQDFADKYLTGR